MSVKTFKALYPASAPAPTTLAGIATNLPTPFPTSPREVHKLKDAIRLAPLYCETK